MVLFPCSRDEQPSLLRASIRQRDGKSLPLTLFVSTSCCDVSAGRSVPDLSVPFLGNCAFDGCNLLERIIFPNPNVEIEGEIYPYSSIIIVGYRHSTADIYAQKYGLVFEELQ